MRKTALAAFAVIALGTAVIAADAQQPPPEAQNGQPLPPSDVARANIMRERMRVWEHHRDRRFGLIYRAEDRNLSPADVQKIAEAFLLWNGNHTWKIINVQDEGDKVGFALATDNGGVIAQFTMDKHRGRIERMG